MPAEDGAASSPQPTTDTPTKPKAQAAHRKSRIAPHRDAKPAQVPRLFAQKNRFHMGTFSEAENIRGHAKADDW
jgi:hypothetical protein